MEIADPRWIMDRMAVDPDRAAVLADIRTLAAAPSPRLEEVERTLTDGYAHALRLEAQRLRLQRELEQSALVLGDDSGGVDAVAGLARGVATTDGELAELRAALALLKETAQRIRSAA